MTVRDDFSAARDAVWAYADRTLDRSVLEKIDAAHQRGSERKYLDTRHWLEKKVTIALRFDLPNRPRCKFWI